MEITEQRRHKEEAAGNVAEPVAQVPENKPVPVPDVPVQDIQPPRVKAETPEEVRVKPEIPLNIIAKAVILITSIIAFFLLVSSRTLAFWADPVAAKLNALIVYGSWSFINLMQPGSCVAQEAGLSTSYYKISLQGDMLALYSLELLISFAALFIFFQNASWIKWRKVFISLVPLAFLANILRVVMAFGLALNYGAGFAGRYFHGILVGVVFVIILLGLMLFEYLSSID